MTEKDREKEVSEKDRGRIREEKKTRQEIKSQRDGENRVPEWKLPRGFHLGSDCVLL